MLLTKETEVKITPNTYKYYKTLGYKFEHTGDTITIKIQDLPKGSNIIVEVLCDYCKKEICHIDYYDYNKRTKLNGKYACIGCRHIKTKENNKIRYGVDSTSELDKVKTKYKQTCLKKYGVDNYSKTRAYKEKYANTCLEKYGKRNPAQNIDIQAKMAKTLYKNSSQKASIQQLYLHNLYGGELNYPIGYLNADICFSEEYITIEYNGGGHDLPVKMKNMTQEEFNQKEIIRNNIIKRAGYKQITIISSKDFLPSDEILLKMLEQAKQYFNTTNHTWVEYNIDTSLMRNAENKEGVFFDFGELRKIKKAS